MLRTLSRTSSKPKNFPVSVPTLYIVASGDKITHTRPSPRIPLELIELVLSFLSWGICTRSTLSQAFISGFALASRTFREIVFKNFFRSIFLQDACWDRTLKLLSISQARGRNSDGFVLIRALDTCPMYIAKDCLELRRLTGLEHLRLNFEKEGLQTQHPICQRLFPNLASSKLSSLIIDMIPRIDRTLLSLISRSFPCLKVLKLSVTERLTIERDCFCWCCFEDVLECCVHSPIPDSYGDVSLLAQSYAAALQPLFQLIELQLGVFLSEERMVYQHMMHPDEQGTNCIATSPSTCTICEMFSHEIRIQEQIASRIVFQNLPNLRQIRWSTFFDRPDPENELKDEMSFRTGWATFERKDESLVRL
ncbi:hypothetical protein DFH05DRAFT_1051885 [Lentinula detonsa]|uniref:F-box domain-containing protein n=1 Tax=Lentinula detonsa TaxID=2804962 RepID=A0A9W8P2T1_9AGAR|nr:hypothetical protein DFH05DRAFT_1051885 [Lentinula detonsa]